MDNENLKKLRDYAVRRKELLDSIYDITNRKRFLGEQAEIDDFVEYLKIRGPYYNELETLTKQIASVSEGFTVDFNSPNPLHREVSQLFSSADSVKSKIMEIDRINNENMQKLTDNLRKEIKNIKVSKKARASYNFFQVQSGDNGGFARHK